MTNIQQIGVNSCAKEQINFKQKPNNIYQVNFKNNDKDAYVKIDKQPVYTQPPMYDRDAVLQRTTAKQDRDRKKQKIKSGILAGLTAAAMLAIIITCLPAIKSLFGKNGVEGMVWTKEQADATKAINKDLSGISERHIDCYGKELKTKLKHIKDGLLRDDYEKKGENFGYFMLLSGPGGTGKSDTAERIALMVQECFPGSEYFVPNLSILTSSGISGQNVALVEQYAKNLCIRLDQLAAKGKKGVVFLDEIDRIGMKDNSLNAAHSNQSIGSLKTLLDIIKTKKNVVVISATNYLKDMEEAIGSRMNQNIEVGYLTPLQIRRSTADWYKKIYDEDPTAVVKELTDVENSTLITVANILGKKESESTWRIWEAIRHETFENSKVNNPITMNDYLDAVINYASGACSALKLSATDINAIKALKTI